MSLFEWITAVFGTALVFFWLRLAREGRIYDEKSKKLRETLRHGPGPSDSSPLVSVIVPARNEAENIAGCLESLGSQDYPKLEIIAVNDRSDDATGAIMSRIAEQDPRIKALHVNSLPMGWLGKNHALHSGAHAARGEILLFTDGDVLFAPEAVAVAVKSMTIFNLDHLVPSPTLLSKSFFLSALKCFFGIAFLSLVRPSRIGKKKGFYVGAGAFNMVTRAAYQKIGGHERLRLEVIDDLMLGKLLVESGARQDMVDGRQWLRLQWYPTVWGMIRGFEKNGFAAFRYSVPRFLGFTAAMISFYLLPYVLPFLVGLPAVGPVLIALVLMRTMMGITAWKMGYNPIVALLMPFAAWTLYFAHLRSMVLTLARGKVVWRETAYPLEVLRKNMV